MVSPGYKAIMVKESAYNKLLIMRDNLDIQTKADNSISDAIQYLLQRTLLSVNLSAELRNYILEAIKIVKDNKEVQGIALFGSIAKGSYNDLSDVDFLIVVKSEYKYTKRLWEVRKKLLPLEENFIKQGKYYRFSPLILSIKELNNTIPLYFDIADYGIILYEKDDILTRFFDRIKALPHKRRITPLGVELKWKKM